IRQVLLNLLSNAVKFTEAGTIRTHIRAQSDSKGTTVHFDVEDTGIGIPEQKIDSIFQTFQQLQSSTTRKFGGTGLGLAISKHLTELMGGQCEAKSEPGAGSTFSFWIQTEIGSEPRRPFERSNHSAFKGKQMLLIESDGGVAEILARQVRAWGMDIEHRKCFEEIRPGRKAYDIILAPSDATTTSHGPSLLTGLAETGTRVIGIRKLGCELSHDQGKFSGLLTKPLKTSDLFARLNAALSTEAPLTRIKAAGKSAKPGQQYPLRILAGEDNPINQQFLRMLLSRLGYEADFADNGLEVLKCLDSSDYDLILMDVQMPELDGLEATRRINRQLPPERRPVIVALTANSTVHDRQRCMQAGMDDFLTKPVCWETVQNTLLKWAITMKEAV
ncbi:MAG: ATP-binding protein, partial [Verrucomicrobiota bacterium]